MDHSALHHNSRRFCLNGRSNITRTSAPGHPNANGKAESGVKAAKKMMEKCKRSNTDPFMALFEIRNSPTQGAGSSPSQRLINRRTRTLLPMTHNLLWPRGELEHECDKLKLKHNQTMQATYNNRRAKDLTVLKGGDRVRLTTFVNFCQLRAHQFCQQYQPLMSLQMRSLLLSTRRDHFCQP